MSWYVKLAVWARSVGVHPQTAPTWVREDRMPVPFRRLASGTILVDVVARDAEQPIVLYARLTEWATGNGHAVARVVTEFGSGLNGKRPKRRRILSDPSATVFVVEHRDRLARVGVEHLQAALAAQGGRIVVADAGETTEDLVRDMIEVSTSMCARLYGRRGARNRARRAVTATKGRGPVEVLG